MKYNSNKKQAYNNWKKRDRTPAWAKINKKKKVYEARYYEVLTNLQGTLNFLDSKYDKSDLEELGKYLLNIHIERQILDKNHDYNNTIGVWFSSFISHIDRTGYDIHWELDEINYSRLAEKMLGITEKNKLKCLGGNRWVIWKRK